jgi:hypothetical protein
MPRYKYRQMSIFVCVQPHSTTLFWVPFPHPTPQEHWDWQLRDKLETEIRGLCQATLRTRGTFGKPIQEGVPEFQRGPKTKLPRPTNSIFRDDRHLPAMVRLTGGYARCVKYLTWTLLIPILTTQADCLVIF